jgi:transcriptional regulator GlxA family with amidase domain
MLNTHLMNNARMEATRSNLAPWKIRCVQAFIAVNLHSALRDVDIAKAANCGLSQLKRVFEETLGCTPYQYITRRRVARAQNLMLLSNDSLCAIAAECGFANVATLNRLFRRIVGESPSTWRLVNGTALSVPAGMPIYGTTNSARRQQHLCDKRG